MNGRIEHELEVDAKTKVILAHTSPYVTDYYYTLTASKEATSRKEYVTKIKAFLDYAKCDVTDVTDSTVAQYFKTINDAAIARRGRELSSSYLQQIYAALNGFFKYLKKKKIIEENPVEFYEYPKSKDEIKKVALNISELNDTLHYVKSGVGSCRAKAKQKPWQSRDYLIMYMFMNTGMRCEMLREINVDDLRMSDGEFTVVAKGGHKIDFVITPKMSEHINVWLKEREKILNGQNEDALFISNHRRRMASLTISNVVKKYTNAAGHSVSPHKLRASFITNFYEASGHDIEATREAAGHRNADVTLKHYIVTKQGSRKAAQNYMDSVLN